MAATTYDMANLVLKGQLDHCLIRWRYEGKTLDDIAVDLRGRGVDVSRETVRRWYVRMDAESVA